MTGLILLAAGASTRLGKPKQKLLFEGRTLIYRAAESAVASGCEPVVVVLGAYAEVIAEELLPLKVELALNSEWEAGMGASIRCGLSKLLAVAPAVEACLLMVCDQPFVDVQLLQKLLQARAATGKGIAACTYQNTLGTPAVFGKTYFTDLLGLEGQQGARRLLQQHLHDVEAVPFPEGAIDVDTAADFTALLNHTRS
ncbi:nucleotidyltransferase family protein [Pontibacter qinzhouensis]|uniref:Nucleotidyltransferase family protein n=1 Tax=Pontibacter qinzhouensis TaxID=2603253 RepID=A0A5C8JGY8_9BACT|nr:nucleotidyltransferase family protein [Pontibacter qinzhouensis]TXK37009.1 nucleotidyltransferase family protein [Pontibacter qinzhouensis]